MGLRHATSFRLGAAATAGCGVGPSAAGARAGRREERAARGGSALARKVRSGKYGSLRQSQPEKGVKTRKLSGRPRAGKDATAGPRPIVTDSPSPRRPRVSGATGRAEMGAPLLRRRVRILTKV